MLYRATLLSTKFTTSHYLIPNKRLDVFKAHARVTQSNLFNEGLYLRTVDNWGGLL